MFANDGRHARTRRRVCDRCTAEFEYRAITQGVDLKEAVSHARNTSVRVVLQDFNCLEVSRTTRLGSREARPLSAGREILTAAGAKARGCGTQVHVVRARVHAKACGASTRCQASPQVGRRAASHGATRPELPLDVAERSEERRVGKECRSRWS